MAQCLIHRSGSLFKAFISVTGTPNSTATATFGDKVFTGSIGSTGVGTIIVKKKGTYSVTSDASGTQTKSVAVSERNQTYSVNISGAFILSTRMAYSTVSVTRTSSPYGGGTLTSLPSGATIYYGDVLTISGSADDGFENCSLTVNGSTKSGNTYIVNTDTMVTTSASPIKYTLSITQNTGTKITVERTSVGTPGTAAGATKTTLSDGALIYKDDVIKISTEASETAYSTPTLKVNSVDFTSGNTHTVSKNVSVEASTTVRSFTLTISTAANNPVTVNRTSSPYAGATTGAIGNLKTIYYGDKLKFTQSPVTNYSGNYTVTHNGSTAFDKVSGENTLTVNGAVGVSSTASAKELTITIMSFQTNSSVLFEFTVKPGNITWAQMIGTGKWYPSNITYRYLPTWASNGRYCDYLYFTIRDEKIRMHWCSYAKSDTATGSDHDYDAIVFKTKARTYPVSSTSVVSGGTFYAPFDEE